MAAPVTLKGAECKLYVGGKLYPEVQSITWTNDYGENSIFGIDSPYAQEITTTQVTVKGTVNGLRIKLTGGLQGYELRTKINQILHAPYISLRVRDRRSDTDIFWVPQMKVSNETYTIPAKGVVKVNFNFIGIIPYNELDMNG